jgi:hypothetical protein
MSFRLGVEAELIRAAFRAGRWQAISVRAGRNAGAPVSSAGSDAFVSMASAIAVKMLLSARIAANANPSPATSKNPAPTRRSVDYPDTIIQLDLDETGNGTGTGIGAAKVRFDKKKNTYEIQSLQHGTAYNKLLNVRLQQQAAAARRKCL